MCLGKREIKIWERFCYLLYANPVLAGVMFQYEEKQWGNQSVMEQNQRFDSCKILHYF